MMSCNPALYYLPDGFNTSGEKVMGRQVAGESFLRGYINYSNTNKLLCCSPHPNHYEIFQQQCKKLTQKDRVELPTEFIASHNLQALAKAGCIQCPSPAIAELAWNRRRLKEDRYSLCGITHTLSSAEVMDVLAGMVTAPIHPWDALICTSSAAKTVVTRFMEGYCAYLQECFQAHCAFRGLLPVIPLGVDCEYFQQDKDKLQTELLAKEDLCCGHLFEQQPENEVRILFAGRLSYHGKAHPLPMYIALEEVAKKTSKALHLILAGRFANHSIQEHFIQGAKDFCPSVKVTLLDGKKDHLWKAVWGVVDIFCSLSDNIQETFGLTPVEAMAAGLPVIVSDWNGYKDTVRHTIDGFRISTMQASAGCGEYLSRVHATGSLSYDRYIGYHSQTVSLNYEELISNLMLLVESKDLRKTMGESARVHAQSTYDWSRVIRQYQELWKELAERKQGRTKTYSFPDMGSHYENSSSIKKKPYEAINPLRPDPYYLFSHYSTSVLKPTTHLSLRHGVTYQYIDKVIHHNLNSFCRPLFVDDQVITHLVEQIVAEEELTVAQLLNKNASTNTISILLTLLWLAKSGVLHISR